MNTVSDIFWKFTPRLFCLPAALWVFSHLAFTIRANAVPHKHMRVSAPHQIYICPEGATVSMVCATEGTPMHPGDHLRFAWLFTPHQNEECHEKIHPRRWANGSHDHSQEMQYGTNGNSFWITMHNVSQSDQGRYCCLALDIQGEPHHHSKLLQRSRNLILLNVNPRRNDSLQCTVVDQKASEGTLAAVLATAACIMGILSLPLILLLVYKQRQTNQSSRRSHELVRMDSEAQGHENPVYLGDVPQARNVSHILTRQSSETGRHLLSEPFTPTSPSGQGEVFFPAHEPIPESTDFMQL